jgi:DNA polymerase-3 subunit delta
MRIDVKELDRHLEKGLQPVYLIAGDEEILVIEAADKIRAKARAEGYVERELLYVDSAFDWNALTSIAASGSLFASQKLIDVRMPQGVSGKKQAAKSGEKDASRSKAGSKALIEYCENLPEGNLLVLSAGKLDAREQKSAWFKAMEQAGCVIVVWPVKRERMGEWIAFRLRQKEIRIEREALQIMVDRLEGNLMAAAQEVDKLAVLFAPGSTLDAKAVNQVIGDSSRFDSFGLIDAALSGQAARVARMLDRLRSEGTQPASVLFVLIKTLRELCQMADAVSRGQRADQVIQAYNVWSSRVPLYTRALHRDRLYMWSGLLTACLDIEQIHKGYSNGRIWQKFNEVFLAISGVAPLTRER